MQPSDSHETAQENVGRPTLLFGFIPLVPLAFLGLGIYRAWIEIAFVGSFTGLPAHAQNIFGGSLGVRDLFDGSMVAASFACADLRHKLLASGSVHRTCFLNAVLP